MWQDRALNIKDRLSSTATLTVDVRDVNDQPPAFQYTGCPINSRNVCITPTYTASVQHSFCFDCFIVCKVNSLLHRSWVAFRRVCCPSCRNEFKPSTLTRRGRPFGTASRTARRRATATSSRSTRTAAGCASCGRSIDRRLPSSTCSSRYANFRSSAERVLITLPAGRGGDGQAKVFQCRAQDRSCVERQIGPAARRRLDGGIRRGELAGRHSGNLDEAETTVAVDCHRWRRRSTGKSLFNFYMTCLPSRD